MDIRFFVPGTPIPKGNHDAFPIPRGKCDQCKPGAKCSRKNCYGGTIVGTVVTDSAGKELEAWEQFVKVHAMSARNAAGLRPIDKPGALEVRLIFLIARPQGHWLKDGSLSSEGKRHPLPTTKPDWDKVSRATADALTGALCEDDSQIALAAVSKVFAHGKPGVAIRARQIYAPESWVIDELRALGIRTSFEVQGGLF